MLYGKKNPFIDNFLPIICEIQIFRHFLGILVTILYKTLMDLKIKKSIDVFSSM